MESFWLFGWRRGSFEGKLLISAPRAVSLRLIYSLDSGDDKRFHHVIRIDQSKLTSGQINL